MKKFFKALTDEQSETLKRLSVPRRYNKDETIYSVGMGGSSAFFIETGKVEVSVTNMSGSRTLLSLMGPGEILGDIAMLDGGPRSADATAATETSGRVLTRTVFLEILEKDTALAMAIIELLCGKLRTLTDIYADQRATDASRRLSRSILRLFDKWGKPGSEGVELLDADLSQSDLGDFAGLARENVNRHMRRWTETGILSLDADGMRLLDRVALERIADNS